MNLKRVWLHDFRNYQEAEVALAPGVTVVVGSNGEGKTNLLEAIGYVATLSSFRGAPNDALIRHGTDRAVIRAEGEAGDRAILVEAELVASGRNRVLVNRQPLKRAGFAGLQTAVAFLRLLQRQLRRRANIGVYLRIGDLDGIDERLSQLRRRHFLLAQLVARFGDGELGKIRHGCRYSTTLGTTK